MCTVILKGSFLSLPFRLVTNLYWDSESMTSTKSQIIQLQLFWKWEDICEAVTWLVYQIIVFFVLADHRIWISRILFYYVSKIFVTFSDVIPKKEKQVGRVVEKVAPKELMFIQSNDNARCHQRLITLTQCN